MKNMKECDIDRLKSTCNINLLVFKKKKIQNTYILLASKGYNKDDKNDKNEKKEIVIRRCCYGIRPCSINANTRMTIIDIVDDDKRYSVIEMTKVVTMIR